MNTVDKISKEVKLLFDGSKDNLSSNLLSAVSGGILQIDRQQLEKLIQIVNASVDDSYSRGIGFFRKSLSKELESTPKK